MKIYSVLIISCILLSGRIYAAPLQVWDYSTSDDVKLYVASGSQANLEIVDCEDLTQKSLLINIKKVSANNVPWNIQLKYIYDRGLKAGHVYEVSFMCKSNMNGSIPLTVALQNSPWTIIESSNSICSVSSEWKKFSIVFTVKNDINEPLAMPRFMLGKFSASSELYFSQVMLWDLTEKTKLEINRNLIFNSSFELGDSGYACDKFLSFKNNPNLNFDDVPVIDNATSVTGKNSLKITNTYADEPRVIPHEVRLQPDTKYTLSVWSKASEDNTPLRCYFISTSAKSNTSWAVYSKIFDTSTQWKRYSFSFTTKPNAAFNPYVLWFETGIGYSGTKSTVWIDDLQLDQGDIKEYKAGSAIECSCVPLKNIVTSDTGAEKISCMLNIANNTTSQRKEMLTIKVIDDYSQKAIYTKKVDTNINPQTAISLPVEIQVNGFGAYIIKVDKPEAAIDTFASQDNCVGVIGKYEIKPIDIDETSCVGLNGLSVNVYNHETKKIYFRSCGVSPDKYAKNLAMMGCRIIRDWVGIVKLFSWEAIEKQLGEYDFSRTDRIVDLLLMNKINVLPVLQPPHKHYETYPSWLIEEPAWMRAVVINTGITTSDMNTFVTMPLDKWAEFVKVTTGHYKDKLSHYEIVNEPNLRCPSAKVYTDYLKIAYDAIRDIDKNAQVVGFCSTGDIGGDAMSFIRECCDFDAIKFADILSWHPYHSRELASQTPADTEIASINKLMQEYDKPNMPIWNTELFYIYDGCVYSSPYEAHQIVHRFLVDLGEGVKQSMPVEDNIVWKNLITPEFKYRSQKYLSMKLEPNAIYVAYNSLARLFEGAMPIGKKKWFDSIIYYGFERNEEYIGAIWKYNTSSGMQISFPVNSKTEIYNMFGTRLNYNGEPLEITREPIFIKVKTNNPQNINKDIEQSVITGTIPFVVERCISLQDENKLLFSIRNMSGKFVSSATLSIGDALDRVLINNFIPMELQTFEIPCCPQSMNIDFKLGYGDKEYVIGSTVQSPISLIMREDEMTPQIPIKKKSIGSPISDSDLSAGFSAGYRDGTLLLQIDVNDNQKGALSKHLWNEDGVQIYLDMSPMNTDPPYPKYSKDTYKIVVAAHRNGNQQIDKGGFSGKVDAVTTELLDGYRLVVKLTENTAINFKKRKVIGFDISVEDSDAESRKTELSWHGNADSYQNRSKFGIITLK